MSDFDSNPFSDPFSDKDVTQARNTSRAVNAIDDFNPFEKDQFVSRQPAVLPTSSEPPAYTQPSTSATDAVAAATDDLRRRQEELDRKALDLERRERDMQQSVQHSARINNFPPLPSCFPLKPCFYQDIALDIPSEFQKIVKFVYYTWMVYCALLFLNIFACLTYFITVTSTQGCTNSGGAGTSFGLSILYFFLWTPSSYACWFRPAYNAFRNDSSFYFFMFFFVFFIQSCTCIVQCLGIDGSGTVGYLSGLGMVSCHKGVAAFMLVVGGMFTALAVICFIVLLRIHRYYRSSGASFSKAQAEFAQGVIANKTVQQTTAGVASAAARGAVDQYSGGSYDNRY